MSVAEYGAGEMETLRDRPLQVSEEKPPCLHEPEEVLLIKKVLMLTGNTGH